MHHKQIKGKVNHTAFSQIQQKLLLEGKQLFLTSDGSMPINCLPYVLLILEVQQQKFHLKNQGNHLEQEIE